MWKLRMMTKTSTENIEQIQAAGTAMIVELEEFKHNNNIPDDEIYNADQSGIAYELHTARTLSHQGEKDTVGLIKNTNARTHSYTIMPYISMAGKWVIKH